MSIRFIVLSFLTVILFLGSSAQDTVKRPEIPVDEVSKLITYKEVITEKGSRDELYVRGIEWVSSYFKNPAEVTRTRDRDNGLIKGVHRFKIYYTDKEGFKRETGMIEYDFTLEFKEGRYRYILSNFCLKEMSRQHIERWLDRKDPAFNPQWDDYLKQVDTFVKEWSSNLKKGMQPPLKKEDNW
ncbi:MAG: DUF4468 domain-containing protein [Bacteroidales bacterium]